MGLQPVKGFFGIGFEYRGTTEQMSLERDSDNSSGMDLQAAGNLLQKQGWVSQFKYFDLVDSTNSAARRDLSEWNQVNLPYLYVAEQQSEGRGRSGNRWWSPNGCLMLSLVISEEYLPVQTERWNQLSLLIGVSVATAVSEAAPQLPVSLKWPNDIFLMECKAGGILIESLQQAGRQSFIIGIGLNVQVDWQSAPDEVRQRSTCISSASGNEHRPSTLLKLVVPSIFRWLRRWQEDPSVWHRYWIPRCLLKGRQVYIGNGNSSVFEDREGMCEGVSPDGRLMIRDSGGVVQMVSVGQVMRWS
jgi:BirA family biotin operon repressor/biotin-[acetyl-CoA-carboxylase] ligase